MSEGNREILNWDTPNGRLLRKFIDGLPRDRAFVLNVFGSTPLQMQLDATFLSGARLKDIAEESPVYGAATR